jgi:transcriptional regulator
MYLPPHFAENNPAVLADLIDEIAAATLITSVANEVTVNQVPLLFDREHHCLLGHLARPNSQLQDLAAGAPVVANFTGPQAYISPSWYADASQVPTWNFVSIQVRGVPTMLDSPEDVLNIITRLSQREEAVFEQPWTVDKVPADKLEKMLKVIVGFKIDISSIQGKLKLSQNRSPEDQRGAINGLRGQPTKTIADHMEAGLS